jgi:ATP-binding cassette subfamily C (CFTR/MRP) protein 1
MTSSQRIYNYTQLPVEDHLIKPSDKTLNWPTKGELEFRNCTMRYRPSLEPSLRGIDFKVTGGNKVGIVGRTGAGKSSIL